MLNEESFMNIFESLENLNVSEECFNDIVDIVEYFLGEDYRSFKDNVYDDGSSQAFNSLVKVNNSIKRNKEKNIKRARKEYNKEKKSKIHNLITLDKKLDLLKEINQGYKDLRDAQDEVELERKHEKEAKEFEERYKK